MVKKVVAASDEEKKVVEEEEAAACDDESVSQEVDEPGNIKGVSFLRNVKRNNGPEWKSRITICGKTFNLGNFNSQAEAAEAYEKVANRKPKRMTQQEFQSESSSSEVKKHNIDVIIYC